MIDSIRDKLIAIPSTHIENASISIYVKVLTAEEIAYLTFNGFAETSHKEHMKQIYKLRISWMGTSKFFYVLCDKDVE